MASTRRHSAEATLIAGMRWPVRCTCGKAYDLGKVQPTARFADCDVWRAPCCGREADNRGWTRCYTKIDKDNPLGGRVIWS